MTPPGGEVRPKFIKVKRLREILDDFEDDDVVWAIHRTDNIAVGRTEGQDLLQFGYVDLLFQGEWYPLE